MRNCRGFEPKAALAGNFKIHDEKSPGGKDKEGRRERAFLNATCRGTDLSRWSRSCLLDGRKRRSNFEGRHGMTVISNQTRSEPEHGGAGPRKTQSEDHHALPGRFGGDTYGPLFHHGGRGMSIPGVGIGRLHAARVLRLSLQEMPIRDHTNPSDEGWQAQGDRSGIHCDCGGYSRTYWD